MPRVRALSARCGIRLREARKGEGTLSTPSPYKWNESNFHVQKTKERRSEGGRKEEEGEKGKKKGRIDSELRTDCPTKSWTNFKHMSESPEE